MADREFGEQVAQIVLRGLMAAETVEIDGFGVFYPDDAAIFPIRRAPPSAGIPGVRG